MQAAPSAAKVPSQRPAAGRRTYVIDRGFQLKYTLLLAVLGGVTSGLFATMMYLAHQDALRDLPLSADARAQLASADTTLLMLVVAIAVLMAGALGLLGVLITHRVAGPVYVMSHYITTLAKGRFPALRPLRKNDELKVFFGRFQEALETLRQKELDEAGSIDRAVAALRSPGDSQTALQELESLSQRKRQAAGPANAGG